MPERAFNLNENIRFILFCYKYSLVKFKKKSKSIIQVLIHNFQVRVTMYICFISTASVLKLSLQSMTHKGYE